MRRAKALIERQGEGSVALCPDVDVASHGDTIEQAVPRRRGSVLRNNRDRDRRAPAGDGKLYIT